MVIILLAVLLPLHPTLNSTILWSLQPRLPPALTCQQDFLVGYYEVSQHTIPCGTLHDLWQEVIVNAFQEPPGLIEYCCTASPADVRGLKSSPQEPRPVTFKLAANCL